MANGHGGVRPGAGRKCDPQIAHLRTLIATVMTDDDWIKIINGIVDDARSGDLRSVYFLLALRFGVSTQSLVAAEETELTPVPAGTRPSPFGVADHAPAQDRRGGLSPQGPKGIVASAAVRNPEGIAPADPLAQPIIRRVQS